MMEAAPAAALVVAEADLLPEVYSRHFSLVPPERGHVTGTMASGLFVYAAWAAIGDDGSSTHRASGRIFADIAAMKAGRPMPRKIRKMPAWITPAVWVPGGRQGAGSASPARRAGSV